MGQQTLATGDYGHLVPNARVHSSQLIANDAQICRRKDRWHHDLVGETFGAAYAVVWFDSIEEMDQVCDRYHGKRSTRIDATGFHLE